MMPPPIPLFVLPTALAIDRLIGDPRWLWNRVPHPVVSMGRLIDLLDGRLNDPALPFPSRRRRGILAVLLLVLVAAATGWLLELAISALPLGAALEAIAVAILLSQGSLIGHVSTVARRLASEGVTGGRAAVALIVGRDVSVLDEAGVARAAIESLAENFSDGLVAPVFWYALLGLPGLLVFKIVSTADSMIGHRSERHAAFGWAAARLDDVAGFIPARISAFLIIAAAALTARSARQAALAALRDAPSHKSPNAGWPEAATAGALDLALGGPRRYEETRIDGAWLNRRGRQQCGADDIRAAIRLIDTAWALLFIAATCAALIGLWIGR